MTGTSTLKAWVAIAVVLSVVACGDDDEDDTSATGGRTSAAGSGGEVSGGRGGNAGSFGSGGRSGGAGNLGRGGNSSGGDPGTSGGVDQGGSAGATSGGAGSSGDSGEPGTGGLGNGGAGTAAGAGGVSAGAGAAGEGGVGGASLAALTDAQILLALDTLNDGEVDQASAALPRLSGKAASFANDMINEHTTARQDGATLAQSLGLVPEPSPLQIALKNEGEAVAASLRTAPGASLNLPYIETQVVAHGNALVLVNSLGEVADSASLQQFLATLRTHIQAHYAQAVSLQQELAP